MKPTVESTLRRIFGYPFFQNVGANLPANVTTIKNWPAAARSCHSQKWSACQLMARNFLSRSAQNISWQRGVEEWGQIANDLRPPILSFVDELILKIPVSELERKNVKNAVSWDIMLICFEHEYKDIVPPSFYVPYIEPWYAIGRFPCGWDGDEFPDGWDGIIAGGQLMVY